MNSYLPILILYYFFRSEAPTPSPVSMHLLPVVRPGAEDLLLPQPSPRDLHLHQLLSQPAIEPAGIPAPVTAGLPAPLHQRYQVDQRMNRYYSLLTPYYFFRPATLRPASSFMHHHRWEGLLFRPAPPPPPYRCHCAPPEIQKVCSLLTKQLSILYTCLLPPLHSLGPSADL